jgi:hypothetical protein
MLGSRISVDNLLRNEVLREKINLSLPLPELIDRVSSVFNVEPGVVRQQSKARSLAEARVLICYPAIRELEYKGLELAKELQ